MAALESALAELGIVLPVPAAPIANYVPFVITGSLLFVSGQLAFGTDGALDPAHKGKLGAGVGVEAGQEAARRCFVNVLAQAKIALDNLDRIAGCVRLGGFINADPAFTDLPAVMNGASDLAVRLLGENGRHARTTVGVSSLPLGCAVEVEALFAIT